MMRRNGRQPTLINILEEFPCLEEQTEDTESVRSYSVAYYKGDVVVLKHNYKHYVEPFFLAVLFEGFHKDGVQFVEENLTMKWLDQSEEDPLLYEIGNELRQNSSNCILDSVDIAQDCARFILSLSEEQRLTRLANGSRKEGYTETSDDDVDGSSDDNVDVATGYHTNDQPRRLDAELSRSGRRTTRFQL